MDVGWCDARDRTYRLRYIEEYGFCQDPHFEAMVRDYAAKPGLLILDRQQLIRDRDWYGSEHFNEFRRPSHCDSSLYCFYPAAGAGPDCFYGFGLTRACRDRRFTAHDRQFCHWLFHELGPLIGKQLAAPGEPSPTALAPRLQQTLRCLLDGDSEKQAAVRLGVSKATVHEYVTALYRHFGVSSRAELLARWLRFMAPPG